VRAAQIIVAWRAILPIDELDWSDSVDLVIAELQDEHGRIIRPATREDSRMDLLLVCYLATDHERIVEDNLLSNLLSNATAPATLIVFGCGKRPRGSEIQQSDVREMMISQTVGITSELFFGRTRSVDDFKDQTRKYLVRNVRRSALANSHEYDFDSDTTSPGAAVYSDSLRAEYIL
jgi:hypothetical protein